MEKTDKEFVLELCQRLRLTKGEPFNNPSGTRTYSESECRIEIGSGESYYGLMIIFVFDESGMFKYHEIYE